MGRWCRGCERLEDEVAYLRKQLESERAERAMLTQQLVVATTGRDVSKPPPPDPVHGSWAVDQDRGLVMVRDGEETEWMIHPESKEEGRFISGQWVRRDEFERHLSEINAEAAGMHDPVLAAMRGH